MVRLSKGNHFLKVLATMLHNVFPLMAVNIDTFSVANRFKPKMMELSNC